MSALEKACEQISDAFREERKEYQRILSQGHHVKAMVAAGRYSFHEACKVMDVTAFQVRDAHFWLIDDNARMNVKYDVDCHHTYPADYIMAGWMTEQEEARVVPFPRQMAIQSSAIN